MPRPFGRRLLDNAHTGGFEDTLVKLKASGVSAGDLQELLNSLRIEPVFTAHPTEPTRRTILRKEQNIVRHLVELLNPTMTAQETNVALENIRLISPRLIIPMHFGFAGSPDLFFELAKKDYVIDYEDGSVLLVKRSTLPKRPEIRFLQAGQ